MRLIASEDHREIALAYLSSLDKLQYHGFLALVQQRRADANARPKSSEEMGEFARRFDEAQDAHDWRWMVTSGDLDAGEGNTWNGPSRHPDGIPAPTRARYADLDLGGGLPALSLSTRDDGSAMLLADGRLAIFELAGTEVTDLETGRAMLHRMGFKTFEDRLIIEDQCWRIRIKPDR